MSFSIVWSYEEDGKLIFCTAEEYMRRFPPSFPRVEKLFANAEFRENFRKALNEKYGKSEKKKE